MMMLLRKPLFLLILVLALVAIVIIFIGLLFLNPSEQNNIQQIVPSPTPLLNNTDPEGTFRFTPLSKTQIGKTTQDDIEKRDDITSKSTTSNGSTTYFLESATIGLSDEVIIQNGVVASETTQTFNLEAGKPPKLNVYEQRYGQPELVLPGVSSLGKHISAYIYATKGFTLFTNPSTETVYMIQRFIPMSLSEYQSQYAKYLQEAPPYAQESFTGAGQP